MRPRGRRAIATRRAGEGPAEVLLHALHTVGAFIGAVTGALQMLDRGAADEPDRPRDRLREATAAALEPWRRASQNRHDTSGSPRKAS